MPLNILPAFSFALFACLMIYGALTMEPSFSGSNQHRLVPLVVSIAVLVMSLMLVIRMALGSKVSMVDVDEINARPFFVLVIPLIVLLAAYAQGQIWFGYLATTFVCGFLAFILFGNGVLASLLHSVIGTAALYLIFFKLLKLYSPPGRLLDLSLPF